MKKSTRRTMMMSSLAMLLVAVLALGTATYAWFTASNKGYISNIEFTATAADGIQLSADGLAWTSNLDFSAFNVADTTLSPRSTNGILNNGTFVMYRADMDANTGTFTTVQDTNGYYDLVFYVYNSGSADVNVFLGSETTVEDGDPDHNTTLATRIGLVKWNDQVTFIEGSAEYQQNLASLTGQNGGVSFIYEPTAHADYYAVIGAGTGLQPVDPVAIPHVIANGSCISTSPVAVQTQLGNTTTNIGVIEAGKVALVHLYIWIEGQDIDCSNAVASGAVTINLVFEKANAN